MQFTIPEWIMFGFVAFVFILLSIYIFFRQKFATREEPEYNRNIVPDIHDMPQEQISQLIAILAQEQQHTLTHTTHNVTPSISVDDDIQLLPKHIAYERVPLDQNPTALPLGMSPTQTPIYIDILNQALHIGLYGTSGAGKDTLLRCWFLALTTHNTPQQVQFAILDGKGDWLTPNLQHLDHMFIAPAGGYGTKGDERILAAIHAIDAEAERRYELIRQAGCRTREAYNELGTAEPLPLLLIIATDVMTSVAGAVERLLVSLVSKARSLGIRVVVSMQTPTGKNMQWRMNLSTVVAGALQQSNQDAPALGIATSEMRYRPSRLPDPKTHPGIFVVRRGTEQMLVKAPYISDTQFDEAVALLPTRIPVSHTTAFLPYNGTPTTNIQPDTNYDIADIDGTYGDTITGITTTRKTNDNTTRGIPHVEAKLALLAKSNLSANDIYRVMGGNRNEVLSSVRRLRS